MNNLPQSYPVVRATRVRPGVATPVVLRTKDGSRTPGRLEIVSITGGLLSLARVFNGGSQVKLMFVTDVGPVLAPIELLRPVSWGQQAFRFSGMCDADRRKLQSAVQSWLGRNPADEWIEKYRAALAQPRPTLGRAILQAIHLSR
jgi:hypothetical protein